MPRLWDVTTQRGRESLVIVARELGMFNFAPDEGWTKPVVKVVGKLEDTAEIEHLMREAPGFEREK